MGTRSFAYDHPNYTLVRVHDAGISATALASGTAFAHFRSRVKVVVNAITIVVTSAASVGAVTFAALRGGSATGVAPAIVSATSVGAMTTTSCAITLASAGEALTLTKNEGAGEFHVLYEYNVVPTGSMYSNQ